MPEQNKKLAGFEALYQVDQEKRQRQQRQPPEPETTPQPDTAKSEQENPPPTRREQPRTRVSKSESKLVSNITPPNVDLFEPTTFKADRRKVKALKRLALDLEPARKLQDLFDEALADILTKYGRNIE